jgi:hypothetical protein
MWRDKLMCWGYDFHVSRSLEQSQAILMRHIARAK